MVGLSNVQATLIAAAVGGLAAIVGGYLGARASAQMTAKVSSEVRQQEREEEALAEYAERVREIGATLPRQLTPGMALDAEQHALALMAELQAAWRDRLVTVIRVSSVLRAHQDLAEAIRRTGGQITGLRTHGVASELRQAEMAARAALGRGDISAS